MDNHSNGKKSNHPTLKELNERPEYQPEMSTTPLDNDEQRTFHRCINVKVFLALMCWLAITQGFGINGVNNVNIQMLERRFQLTSTETGLEASFYDILAACSVLFVGYFGGNTHQPRLLGCAALCLALGTFIMALPHFTTDVYQPANVKPQVCDLSDNSTLCGGEKEEGLSNYLYVLLLGQGLNGLAGTCLYSLGISYLDGSVSAKWSPVYLGLFYGSSALGPAIGYLLGGHFLTLYVDIPKPAPEGLSPDSPAWVGAWWLGYLVAAVLSLIIAVPIFMFPRVLPGSEERRKDNKNQAHNHGSQHEAHKEGFGSTIKDLPKSVSLLAKNPVFICQCLVAGIEGFILSGFATFLPKFIANQFGIASSLSATITGFVAVPGAALGQFLGGFILRRLNLQVAGMIKMNMLCCVAVAAFCTVFWARCDVGTIPGVTSHYNRSWTDEIPLNLEESCNTGCGCDTERYDPVCVDHIQYFSACHAGCITTGPLNDDGKLTYTNCSCQMAFSNNQNVTAVAGKCKLDCGMLWVFIPFIFGAMLFTFFMTVPGATIALRSVADSQRAFAISIQQFTLRVVGSIPGPLAFGALLDQACITWQEKCEIRGSCWIYDNFKMSRNFYILAVAGKATSFSLLCLALYLYKPPPSETDESTNGETSDTKVELSQL